MMASLFSRLFGRGTGGQASDGNTRNEEKAVEYDGFRIVPAPMRQQNGWLTAGFITKEVNGEMREHRFIRADTLASVEAAEDHAILKAKRTIDEQGEAIFKNS